MRDVEMIYSPDDGGWYGVEWDLKKHRRRTTKRIYPTEDAAWTAIRTARPERLVWESWSGGNR